MAADLHELWLVALGVSLLANAVLAYVSSVIALIALWGGG